MKLGLEGALVSRPPFILLGPHSSVSVGLYPTAPSLLSRSKVGGSGWDELDPDRAWQDASPSLSVTQSCRQVQMPVPVEGLPSPVGGLQAHVPLGGGWSRVLFHSIKY